MLSRFLQYVFSNNCTDSQPYRHTQGIFFSQYKIDMLILQAQNLHNFNSFHLKIGYPGTFVQKILSLHKKLGCLKVHILYLFKRTLSQVSVHSFGHSLPRIHENNTDCSFLFCFEIYPITFRSSSSLQSPQVGGFVLLCASVLFSACWSLSSLSSPRQVVLFYRMLLLCSLSDPMLK